MEKEFYINLIYKNLKGTISPDEFQQLNRYTASNTNFAQERMDLEDVWDLTGDTPLKIPTEETTALYGKITNQGKYKTHDRNKTKIVRLRSLRPLLSGIAAILIIGFITWWITGSSSITYDQPGSYTLADNSTVTLHKGTLTIHNFNTESRVVELSGEAIFEVSKDLERPFKVETKNNIVQVLGTEFLVKEKEEEVFVQVYEGKVKSTDRRSNDAVILSQGMSIRHDKSGQINTENTSANLAFWKKEYFEYKKISFKDIAKELKILFDKNLQIENKQMQDCLVTALIQGSEFEAIVNQLARSFDMTVNTINDQTILSGGSCN